MPVTIETDETLERVTVTVPEGTRWASFETAVSEAISRQPALTDWAWILDDRGPIESIDVAGVARIGEDFQRRTRDPRRVTYTVVVTNDRFFDAWLKVVDLNHGSRKHFSAPTLAAARDLLDRLLLGESNPAPSRRAEE